MPVLLGIPAVPIWMDNKYKRQVSKHFPRTLAFASLEELS
jgi:hypothetical protein